MSRAPASEKLCTVIKTPTEPTDLLIRFRPESEPPAGFVRDSAGREQQFSGWLGLLGLLEAHVYSPVHSVAPATRQENA